MQLDIVASADKVLSLADYVIKQNESYINLVQTHISLLLLYKFFPLCVIILKQGELKKVPLFSGVCVSTSGALLNKSFLQQFLQAWHCMWSSKSCAKYIKAVHLMAARVKSVREENLQETLPVIIPGWI